MKEIMAFIRTNKVAATKEALAAAGFPAFTCRKCMGKGKVGIDPNQVHAFLQASHLPSIYSETQAMHLISKRLFTVIAEDNDVDNVVRTIIGANQTGAPGDGKIFVLPVSEAYTVRCD